MVCFVADAVIKSLPMRYPGKKAEMIGHTANALIPAVPAGFFLADAIHPLPMSFGISLLAMGGLMLPPLAIMIASHTVAKSARQGQERDWRLDSRMVSRALGIDSLGVATISSFSTIDQIVRYHNKDFISVGITLAALSLSFAINFGLKAHNLSRRLR